MCFHLTIKHPAYQAGRCKLFSIDLSMHAILNFITPYFMLTAGLFSMENWVRGGSSYRLQQQSIRRLVLVPPYFVFCSISFRCGGLSIERNQKPLTPENTLAVTHHDKQKQVEVKRSSRANPHEIRLFSGCPYAVVKQGTKKFTKK